jgi:ABC-type branched-subunit amino acid transport system ATPase component
VSGRRVHEVGGDDAGPELVVRTVVKSFGGNRAVAGVSLSLDRGSILGLIGPNGAGKSTLGSLVCGSLRPDGGEILLRGVRIQSMPPHRRARLGLARTFQLSSEFQRLTVMENLLVAGALREHAAWWRSIMARRRWQGVEKNAVLQARQLLADFELSKCESTLAGQLSGGQRRLVEIARALMGAPTVLLLDEPMAGLSPHMVERVAGHLQRLRTGGLGLLLIEHNVGLVSSLSDRVVAMSQGVVIAEGAVDEVLGNDEVQAIYVAG